MTRSQVQLNRQSRIDIKSGWRANLSMQISRHKTHGNEPDTVATANGTLGYNGREVFGIRNLIFRSELLMNSVGLKGIIVNERNDGPRSEFFRSEWKNRLEYRIGQLALLLTATLFNNDNGIGDFFSLRLQRSFSGI